MLGHTLYAGFTAFDQPFGNKVRSRDPSLYCIEAMESNKKECVMVTILQTSGNDAGPTGRFWVMRGLRGSLASRDHQGSGALP